MMLKSLTLLAALTLAPAAHAIEYRSVVPAQSRIGFEFTQMGVKIPGHFQRFTAQMVFDPAKPETARATLEIDLASIDAGSPEADEESAGKLWFNRAAFPRARFVSSRVRALGNNRFELAGTLTLKGKARPMVIPVSFVPGKSTAFFDGSFVLKRLDFGIGEGMWADVETVANEVTVRFRIAATGK